MFNLGDFLYISGAMGDYGQLIKLSVSTQQQIWRKDFPLMRFTDIDVDNNGDLIAATPDKSDWTSDLYFSTIFSINQTTGMCNK